jgi:hypothetical protein
MGGDPNRKRGRRQKSGRAAPPLSLTVRRDVIDCVETVAADLAMRREAA